MKRITVEAEGPRGHVESLSSKELRISPDITKEMFRNGGLLSWYSAVHRIQEEKVFELTERMKVTEAILYKRVRSMKGVGKTETAIKHAIHRNPKYRRALDALIEARRTCALTKSLFKEAEQRGMTLHDLSDREMRESHDVSRAVKKHKIWGKRGDQRGREDDEDGEDRASREDA